MMDQKKKTFSKLVVILAFLSVSKAHALIPPLAVARPALVLAGLTAFYWFLNPGVGTLEGIKKTWPVKLVSVLAVLSVCSAIFGISQGRAGSFWLQNYSKTLVTCVLMFSVVRDVGGLRRLTWAFVLGVGTLAFLALFVTGIGKQGGVSGYDGNDAALIMVTGIPLAAWLFQTTKGRGKLIALSVLVMALMVVPASESRGGFVALAAMVLAWLLSGGVPTLQKGATIALAVVVFTFYAPDQYWDRIRSLADPTEDYNWDSKNGRRQVALRGMGYMMMYPVFGIGIDNFPMAEGRLADIATSLHFAGTGVRWTAAHNSYVQAGAELGIPGLIAWTGLVLVGIFGVRRFRKRLPPPREGESEDLAFLRAGTIYLSLAFVGFGVGAALVSFAYLDPIYMLSALGAGILYLSPIYIDAMRRPGAGQARRTAQRRFSPAPPPVVVGPAQVRGSTAPRTVGTGPVVLPR